MTKKELMDLLQDAPDDAKVLIACHGEAEMDEMFDACNVHVVYSATLGKYIPECDVELYNFDLKIEGKAEAAVCMEW